MKCANAKSIQNHLKELTQCKADLQEKSELARNLERRAISISCDERKRMHELYAECKELRKEIEWINTHLAYLQWNGVIV